MSGPADRFGQNTDAVSDVRLAELGEYLHEYTGVLRETIERVRILALAPELTEIGDVVDAFSEVSDNWYNASANANILTLLDRGTEPRPWIAVPDYGGDTLATLQPELSPNAIETVISETADALRTLGLYNTVHGYLSPDNIYFPNGADETGELIVEVGGFGLEATIQAAVGGFEPTSYTAPELLSAPDQPTEQTDVYGLGGVTYFALTDSQPVEGDDPAQAIRDGPSVPPSTYDERIPAELDDVVMQALSPRPDDRYDSPYAFGRAFLSTFDPDEFRPDDTSDDSEGEAETTDSTDSDEAESADSADTDEMGITRRAVVGFLGVGVLGGGGWYFFRGQRTAAGPSDQTTTSADQATPTPATTETTTETADSVNVTSQPSFRDEFADGELDTSWEVIRNISSDIEEVQSSEVLKLGPINSQTENSEFNNIIAMDLNSSVEEATLTGRYRQDDSPTYTNIATFLSIQDTDSGEWIGAGSESDGTPQLRHYDGTGDRPYNIQRGAEGHTANTGYDTSDRDLWNTFGFQEIAVEITGSDQSASVSFVYSDDSDVLEETFSLESDSFDRILILNGRESGPGSSYIDEIGLEEL